MNNIPKTYEPSLEIQGNAQVEYRLKDGVTYTADHNSGQWNRK